MPANKKVRERRGKQEKVQTKVEEETEKNILQECLKTVTYIP